MNDISENVRPDPFAFKGVHIVEELPHTTITSREAPCDGAPSPTSLLKENHNHSEVHQYL